VSSFGLSGTNVHAILEEAPGATPAAEAQDRADHAPIAGEPCVLPLSARTPAALHELAAAVRDRLASPELDAPLPAIAHTAALRRGHHAHRLAVAGTTRAAWIAALDAFRTDAAHPCLFTGRVDPAGAETIAFVCSGQGSQWAGMGHELFAASEVFRDSLRSTAAALAPHGGYPVLEAFRADAPPPDLTRGEVVQPLLFALQLAIARLWRSWGIAPGAVTGHSVGEVAAAHLGGALTLDDAARIVAVRSELLARIANQGGMAMIELSAAETATWLARHEPHLSIAAVNAPRSTVVSGQVDAIEALLGELAASAVFARRVKIDVASHSRQVAPLLDELRARLAGIRPTDGCVPIISTVTGAEIAGRSLDADYWAQNLRQVVRFADAIASLAGAGCRRFLEISPHPILAVAVEQTVPERRVIAGSLRRGRGEQEALGEALAALYASGAPVDWARIYRSAQPYVLLPTYPWQRERYWARGEPIDFGPQRSQDRNHLAPIEVDASSAPSLAGQRLQSPGDEVHFVDRSPIAGHPYLEDHRIFDDVVVPGAFHLAAVLSVARELVGSERCVLASVSFPRALISGPAGAPGVHLTCVPQGGEATRFRRASLAPSPKRHGTWDEHASGFIARLDPAGDPAAWHPSEASQAASAANIPVEPAEFYDRNARRGIALGPTFRWIRQLWIGERCARSILERPAALAAIRAGAGAGPGAAPEPVIHPAQLDAVFQTFAAAVPETTEHAYVPFSIDRLEVHGTADEPWRCFARYQPGNDGEFLVGDAVVLGADDRVVARVGGLRLKRVSRAALAASGSPAWSDWHYETRWDRQRLPAMAQTPVGGRWLVFADGHGVADRLADQLRARGDGCVMVTPGEGFARLTEAAYVVAPDRRGDLDQLVAALAGGAPLTEVVFLWGLSGDTGAGGGVSAGAAAPLAWPHELAVRYAGGFLHAVQAVTAAALRDPPRISIVTRGTQRAGGERHRIDVTAALLWGMARSFAHEHPAMGFSRIDLDPAAEAATAAAPTAAAVDALLAELVAGDREDEVLLRHRLRYIARLARSPRVAAPGSVPVRSDGGSYLVTGGLGGLGLRLADWLAEAGAKHLVLVGRGGAQTAAQQAAVHAIEARGASVDVIAADVADRAQLARAVDRARARGPLRGVIHAAGLVDDGLLDRQTLERFHRVLAPKAIGALHLHELTRHELTRGAELDFFVLFSSAAALIGAPGQSNYAAANAVLDALALDRHAQGLPALSVNWGTFSEVGMATQAASRGERLAHRGVVAMSPADGLSALGALLDSAAVHVAVIALEPRQWLESSPYLARAKRFAEVARDVPPPTATRTKPRDLDALRAADPKERRARVALLVRQEIGLVLRLDAQALEPQEPLTSLGFDSLLSLELRNRLESLFGLTLPAVLLWTYPTLESLTEHLAQQLQPAEEVQRTAAADPDAGAPAEDDLDRLTDPEKEALLEHRLAALERRL
jgi:acyl transferase domain-containing protein/acyl carrier protein